MGQYFFTLIITVLIFVGCLFGLLYLLKKRKQKQSKMRLKEEGIVIGYFLLLSGAFMSFYLLELPNVLNDRTELYEGRCEIYISSGRSGHMEANFGEHSISFPQNYIDVEEGNYYCEVEYYPVTETGKTLKVYTSKGGKLINSDNKFD